MSMTHDEMIEVIEAHRDGKVIQFKRKDGRLWSNTIGDPLWDFAVYEYRIKSKPLECWVNIYNDGSWCTYETRDAAMANAPLGGGRTAVHMREVIDE